MTVAERFELRIELTPRSPLALPGAGPDGVMRRRAGVLERLLHVEDRPVLVRAAQPVANSVLLGAWGPSRGACEVALTRMRFALGVDDDTSEFHRRFRDDPLIGRAIRAAPGLRPPRRPEPFEALAWAICEQLIEYPRAVAIERRMVAAPDVTGRVLDGGVGYVRLRAFGAQSAAQLDAVLARLRAAGVRAYVLDLRANGGGYRDAAIAVASHFVRGTVVTTQERAGKPTAFAANTATPTIGAPLAVLVDGDTASAAEIVAGHRPGRHRAGCRGR